MMKKITHYLIFIALTSILAISCKKNEPLTKEDLYPNQPVSIPSTTAIATFHKQDPFYQMYVYRFDTETNKWTNRIGSHFSTVPSDDATVLGFTNPYVTDSGIALFDMVKLYSDKIGSTNIKTAAINSPKTLRFFPDYEGAKTGIVKVVPQDIVISKSPNSTFQPGVPNFKIGISGEGTYDENTKIMNIEVVFNETAIGGAAAVKRKYILSVDPQTLN